MVGLLSDRVRAIIFSVTLMFFWYLPLPEDDGQLKKIFLGFYFVYLVSHHFCAGDPRPIIVLLFILFGKNPLFCTVMINLRET